MRVRTLRNSMKLKGKRVLVRIDANVPIKNGKAVDGPHGKIARAAVGIEWLRQHGARIIAVTHLNRPGGKRVSAYSVRPIARRLSDLMGMKVRVARDVVGPHVERAVEKMQDGEVLLLENVRFDPREKENSPSFAHSLASFADMYVNDAFAVSHRAHASVDAITAELPAYAGPLLANEVSVLSKVAKSPRKPMVVVMGGLKVKSKIPVMQKLLPNADSILVGGALATAFLVAQGHEVGNSVYDIEGVEDAKMILHKWKRKILLPSDVIVASSFRKNAKVRNAPIDQIGKTERIADLGEDTRQAYLDKISTAKTIIWNGPLGSCEIEAVCRGTEVVARGIAMQTGKAITVVGGGDTVPVVEQRQLADRFTLLSTGGGAMLEFLAGKQLPGLQALKID